MKILSALMNMLWTMSICGIIFFGIRACLIHDSAEYDQERPSALEKCKNVSGILTGPHWRSVFFSDCRSSNGQYPAENFPLC